MYNGGNSLTKLTSQIYRGTHCFMDNKLQKYNLTAGLYPYLLILSKQPGISQNEISREINVDKAMSARSVKKLIELNYIKKSENKEDIRAYKLYLTEDGERVIPTILNAIDEWISILTDGSSQEEIDTSVKFLETALINCKNYRKKYCERTDKD